MENYQHLVQLMHQNNIFMKNFIFVCLILILSIIFSINCLADTNVFDKSLSLTGIVGYSIPLSPAGSNSYSESYFPGLLFGAGIKYSFNTDFSLGVFANSTSTKHRTESSAKVTFNSVYLKSFISLASNDVQRIFISAGLGYSNNKVEGTKYPAEWSSGSFVLGAGFEYLISRNLSLEFDINGYGFLPASSSDDFLGISSLGVVLNYYLK